jgi:hypothetical protein
MSAAPLSGDQPFDAGPYVRLQTALRLMEPGRLRTVHRSILIAGLAWVPLVLLAALDGRALGPTPQESLLLDPSVYARYLVALPALVIAEGLCLPRLAEIVRQFSDAGLIADMDRSRYDALVGSTRRLLQQRWAEAALVVLAYGMTITLGKVLYPESVSSWVVSAEQGSPALSLAGWWRILVSQPLFLIFLGSWLWRLLVWTRLLWGTSRLQLRLVPSHPDLAGGIGFLATSLPALSVVAFAMAATVAGSAAKGILADHRDPQSLLLPAAILLAFVAAVIAGPLLVFIPPLIRAHRQATFSYGEVAHTIGRRFEARWLAPRGSWEDDALSAPDFSATTDLFSIAGNVRQMSFVPFGLRDVVVLLAAMLLPFVPVVLAVLPAKEVVRALSKLVL